MKAALLFAIAIGLGTPREDDAAKKELAKFQGEWTVAWTEQGGKKVSDEERKKSKYVLHKVVVADDQVLFWLSEDGGEPREGAPTTLQVDPSKSPKTMAFAGHPA